jgi:hypothetical protein
VRPARLLQGLLVAVALTTPAGPAAAQAIAEVTRPCKPADLVGAWDVIRLGAAASVRVDRSDPAFYPYQRLVFSANATVRELTAQTKITRDAHRTLLAGAAAATWAVDGAGQLLILREGETRAARNACLVLTKEVTDPQGRHRALVGDILLTGYDAAETPVTRRQLRKLDRLGQ